MLGEEIMTGGVSKMACAGERRRTRTSESNLLSQSTPSIEGYQGRSERRIIKEIYVSCVDSDLGDFYKVHSIDQATKLN